MKGRALTPEQKRAVLDRIYAVWMRAPNLRLTQLLQNATHRIGYDAMYGMEDEDIARLVEEFAEKYT